jgi:peptidoglycan/xylan/chitin deacetylase (PgdA/CDA1 family)
MPTLLPKVCALALIATALVVPTASASTQSQCADNPQALGTSRTLAINPRSMPKVGRAQYPQSLPLNAREVVLTFDSGPSFPYTEMILQTLAAECVKATFFTLGSNAATDPDQIRRIASAGHTVGSQTFNHVSLAKLPVAAAREEIDQGVDALNAALQGDLQRTPFFRAPMLQLSPQTERYVLSRGMNVWSMDVDSKDWRESSDSEIVEETMRGLEKAGRGIVVMQDIQPETARALPALLEELKRRKFRVVHVVAGRPPENATSVKTGTKTGPKASGSRARRR